MASGDIVNDIGACCDCSGGDGGAVSVYRDGEGVKRGIGAQEFYCGKGAREFFVWRDLRCVGAGGLASYVKNGDWVGGSEICFDCWEEF